jgi:hypothetical protein
MIFWAHLKTMLSEPGYVPKSQKDFNQTKLPSKIRKYLKVVELKDKINKEKK